MESEFPRNSNEPKAKATPAGPPTGGANKKEIKKVVTGQVLTRKKPINKRIKEFFTGDDSRSVVSYVWFDILIPAAKDTVADAVSAGVEKKLFGETRSRRRSGLGTSLGQTAYHRMSQGGRQDIFKRPDPREPQMTRRGRQQHNFREIILSSRAEGHEVIDQMYALIAQYEVVTVSDLYEMVGETIGFTDEQFGWFDIRGSDVVRIAEGYLLDLPQPVPLD